MKVITIANRKGGVGKTTSVWAIGHTLAQSGAKVLFIDCDPQCNLTMAMPRVTPEQHLGQVLYSSRIALRIQDVKFEPHTGREFGAKLVESVKEIEDGGFKLALGAVKGGVDNFLAQKLPEAFNQVQIG